MKKLLLAAGLFIAGMVLVGTAQAAQVSIEGKATPNHPVVAEFAAPASSTVSINAQWQPNGHGWALVMQSSPSPTDCVLTGVEGNATLTCLIPSGVGSGRFSVSGGSVYVALTVVTP